MRVGRGAAVTLCAVRVALTLEQCWHAVPGGTAVAALGLAEELARRPDLKVVGVAAHHRLPPPEAFRPRVPVRQLRWPRKVVYEGWRRLSWPSVQQAVPDADVVHATTIIVPPRRGRPLVVTVHDLAFLHEPGQFTKHGVRAFRAGLERTRRHADLVLCSSQATLDDCLFAGIGVDRVRLVPLGLAPVDRPSAADVVAVRHRLGLDRPYVLFVGTLEPRKNVGRLIAAVEALPSGHELVLAGPLGWGDAEPPRSDRIRLVGFVDEPTKAALYEGADVFCYPSVREGFGLPVLEAMAHGTPVVTSRGTATAEVAGTAAVLVDPLDVAAIAGGIETALARRDELAAAGLERVSGFTWSETADRVEAGYREVVR